MMRPPLRRLNLATLAAKVARRLRAAVPRRPRPVILMYHRIADESFDPWGLAVSPANFAAQVRWLANNRIVLPLEEFAARHRERSLPATAAAVTFDDGYVCSGEVASPILRQHGVPATIFLPVELIECGAPFWWEELQDIVLGAPCESLCLGELTVALGARQAKDHQWPPGSLPRTPRQRAFERLWEFLRALRPADLGAAMANLRDQSHAPAQSGGSRRPLTPEQVRATADSCIAFGSHALTHPSLPALSFDEKAREIGDSFDRCLALTGSRPAAFAYPYGDFDEESEELAIGAGFSCACATIPSAVTRTSRLFALPRIQVGNWSAKQLGRALATAP